MVKVQSSAGWYSAVGYSAVRYGIAPFGTVYCDSARCSTCCGRLLFFACLSATDSAIVSRRGVPARLGREGEGRGGEGRREEDGSGGGGVPIPYSVSVREETIVDFGGGLGACRNLQGCCVYF